MIEEGTHDYGKADRSDQVKRIEAEYPGVDMVTMPSGALMPRKLADRGDRGWQAEADRDSRQPARLVELYGQLDSLCDRVLGVEATTLSNTDLAHAMAAAWREVRRLTRGQA